MLGKTKHIVAGAALAIAGFQLGGCAGSDAPTTTSVAAAPGVSCSQLYAERAENRARMTAMETSPKLRAQTTAGFGLLAPVIVEDDQGNRAELKQLASRKAELETLIAQSCRTAS